MTSRRNLIKSLSLLPLAGVLKPDFFVKKNAASEPTKAAKRDYFKELGVRTFINAAGTYTFMTASLMREEVKDAYMATSYDFECTWLQHSAAERMQKYV